MESAQSAASAFYPDVGDVQSEACPQWDVCEYTSPKCFIRESYSDACFYRNTIKISKEDEVSMKRMGTQRKNTIDRRL